jgi:hypothetical protein
MAGSKRKNENEFSQNPYSVKSRLRAAQLDPAKKARKKAIRSMQQAIRRKQKSWSDAHPRATEAEKTAAYAVIKATEKDKR